VLTPHRVAALLVATALLAGCAPSAGSPSPTADAPAGSDRPTVPDPAGDAVAGDCTSTADAAHPDVVGAEATPTPDGLLLFSATLCSAYDTPQRYADAWRVRTTEGRVLAVRELGHDHAAEQPFTRSLTSPVEVPDGTKLVVVEGRDQRNGWGGATFELVLGD
jgi:hypothetical protein